jgi:hypothetical protein
MMRDTQEFRKTGEKFEKTFQNVRTFLRPLAEWEVAQNRFGEAPRDFSAIYRMEISVK